VSALLDECDAAGAALAWNKAGPSIFVTQGQRRQVGYIESTRLGIVLTPPTDFPAGPFDVARQELASAGVGTETSTGWYRSISLTDPQLDKAISALLGLIAALVPEVEWDELAEPVEASFTRNDFNLWEAHIPGLLDLHGKTLRAVLTHTQSNQSASASLVPLAGYQPGWKPVFRPATGRDLVWTAATVDDQFTVQITAASSS
jgi:hypothetical protein